MTPLFGQFAAYMIKFNTTFGFTKVLFGGCPNFSKDVDLINHFLLFYQQVMSSLHIYACIRIFRLGAVDLAKTAMWRWTYPKMSIRTWFPIIYSKYTKLKLFKYTPIQNMYQSTVVMRIWCSVLKPIKFYSAKCVKMSTGPNSHGTRLMWCCPWSTRDFLQWGGPVTTARMAVLWWRLHYFCHVRLGVNFMSWSNFCVLVWLPLPWRDFITLSDIIRICGHMMDDVITLWWSCESWYDFSPSWLKFSSWCDFVCLGVILHLGAINWILVWFFFALANFSS